MGPPIINRYEAMTEFELSNTFPLAYHYLLSVRNELSIRNMEKKIRMVSFLLEARDLQTVVLRKLYLSILLIKLTQ